MSSFTKFDSKLSITFCLEASLLLDKDYWLLNDTFTYYLGELGSSSYVTVPKGFLSDGASVPAIGRILVPIMGRHSQAAFLHDYLCETYKITVIENGETKSVSVNRRQIDQIFYEALKVSKIPKWRFWIIRAFLDTYRFLTNPKKPKVKEEKVNLEKSYRLSL